MDFDELMSVLKKYKNGEISPSYDILEPDPCEIENEYIQMKDCTCSNKRQEGRTDYLKQWNIIYFPKKSFEKLPNFQQLKNNGIIRIEITPIRNVARTRENIKGCTAIRLYDMVSAPDRKVVNMILKFIFSTEDGK